MALYKLVDFFEGDPRIYNYLINYSDKLRCIYVETPKVACGTVKRTLQYLEVDKQLSALSDDPHKRNLSPLRRPLEDEPHFIYALTAANYMTFSFVRHPYTRVLSCYLDKFVLNTWEQTRMLPILGLDPDGNIDFGEFLERLGDNHLLDDIHWMPQYEILKPDKIKYDFIGRFEHFQDDFYKLLQVISNGLNIELTHDDILKVGINETQASEKLHKYYNSHTKTLVDRLYANDFHHFGYGKSLDVI